MLRYADFISDLRRFVAEAIRLRSHKKMHLDPAFRRWRHELETSVSQAETAGFEVPGVVRVRSRSFGVPQPLVKGDALFALYQREMDDTIIELETIFFTYEKIGEPEKRKASDLTPREWPAKITLAWLFHNAPLSLWLSLLSALLAAFILGTQIGQSELSEQVQEAIMGAPASQVK